MLSRLHLTAQALGLLEIMIKFLAIIMTAVISGCAMIPRDLSSSQDVVESGWVKGKIYKSMQQMFFINDAGRYFISRSTADHLSNIIAHQCGSTVLPRSIREYKTNPEKWGHIEKILPVGTEIRFDQALHAGGLFGYFYNGLGSLTISGTLLIESPMPINLRCISIADHESQLFRRDVKWLQE